MAHLLTEAEVQNLANNLSGWTIEGSKLHSQRQFKDFYRQWSL